MRAAQRSVDCAAHLLIPPQHEKTSREPPTDHPRINDEAFSACNTFFGAGTQGNLSHQTKRRFVHAAPKIIPS